MEIDKIRATTDAELKHQEHELSDQLFRLKFQMKMGQTESLKKIRGLRKDIARIKTVTRERALGVAHAAPQSAPIKAKAEAAAEKPAAKRAARKTARSAETKRTEKK